MKIRKRNLELIADYLSNLINPDDICSILRECSVPEDIIVENHDHYGAEAIDELFGSSKRLSEYLLNQTFDELDKRGEHNVGYKVITTLLHPLTFKGNTQETYDAINVINGWLKYDNLELEFTGTSQVILRTPRSYEQIKYDDYLYEQQLDEDLAEAVHSIKTKHLDDLALLKNTYQLLINITEIFLEDITFLDEMLNEAYIKLFKDSWRAQNRIFNDDAVKGMASYFSGNDFYKPFDTLYGAESQIENLELPVVRHGIKVRMYKYFGEITELCVDCNASNIVADSKTQKYLNDISLYLSSIKENRQKVSTKTGNPSEKVEWPDNFNWDDSGNFSLTKDKKLTFGADKSIRKAVFKLIADARGEWATVSSIAKEIGQRENYVRIVIRQLNEKIVVQGLSSIFSIEPRGEVDKPGAYRIMPIFENVKHDNTSKPLLS